MQSFFEQVAVAVLKKVDEKLDEVNGVPRPPAASKLQALENEVAELRLALANTREAARMNEANARAKAADVEAAHAAELKALRTSVTKAARTWLRKNVGRALEAGGSVYQSRETVLGIKTLVMHMLLAAGANPGDVARELEEALHQQWLDSQPAPEPLPAIELDLHQLTTAHACAYVKAEIKKHRPAHRVLRIITGKGNKSGPRGPQIKPALLELLAGLPDVACKEAPNNAGMLIVQL